MWNIGGIECDVEEGFRIYVRNVKKEVSRFLFLRVLIVFLRKFGFYF